MLWIPDRYRKTNETVSPLWHKRIFSIALLVPLSLATFECTSWAQAGAEPETRPGLGRIEGVVRYESDSERPWKYARYYIKDSRKGFLAEAVVALDGSDMEYPIKGHKPNTVTIDQRDFQFVPETAAIHSGDSVRFTNGDESIHNVMTTDGERPFNVNMPKGGEYIHKFKAAGGSGKPVRLGCVYHGGMRAWIYVFDHLWFKVTSQEGQFEWNDVPNGRYTVEVTHPAGRLEWREKIQVRPGETISLEIVVSPDNIRRRKS